MISLQLDQRVALVTGASGELGRTMAHTLAQAGADLIIHYHQNQARAAQVVAQVQALGRRAWMHRADLRDVQGAQSLRSFVEELGISVDIVVANAVVQYSWKPLLEQDCADFQSQFDATVLQVVRLAQAFVPPMQAKGWGRLIAINTECAQQCLPTQAAYVAGKRGMDGVLRVLAREVGPQGVTVNQVAPGWTEGERERLKPSPGVQAYIQGVPLRRRGTDQEVAHAVAFLASDLAAFITGCTLPVSGGNVMPTI